MRWTMTFGAAAAAMVLTAATPAAAQFNDLLGDVAKDVIRDKIEDEIKDRAGDYFGLEKEEPRPAPRQPRPAPSRPKAAEDALVSAADPEAVREIVSGWGSANLTTTKDGSPRISGRMEGVLYTVRFFGCRRGASCQQIVFSSGFSETGADSELINAWNRDQLFGRAFLTEGGDAVIEMPVNLRFGVSKENLDDTVDLWRVTLAEFRAHVTGEGGETANE